MAASLIVFPESLLYRLLSFVDISAVDCLEEALMVAKPGVLRGCTPPRHKEAITFIQQAFAEKWELEEEEDEYGCWVVPSRYGSFKEYVTTRVRNRMRQSSQMPNY